MSSLTFSRKLCSETQHVDQLKHIVRQSLVRNDIHENENKTDVIGDTKYTILGWYYQRTIFQIFPIVSKIEY